MELTTQVIFHTVRDNHRVVKAGELQRHIFLEIKVKTTQREGGNSVSKTLTAA